MNHPHDPKSTALAYLDAVGRKDFEAFDRLLAPDVTFQGPNADLAGKAAVSAAYRKLGGMLVRNELRKAFVDGSDVCVIYDFVTDTAAGAVRTSEWLVIEGGLVRSIRLLTDHVRWPKALAEYMSRKQPQATA
jgi:hypothetical protein